MLPHVGKDSVAGTAGISTIEPQFEQSRSTIVRVRDPKLRAQITDRAVEFGAVMQFDVVDAEANIVQQVRAEGVAPVNHLIVDGRVREAGAQQGKRIDCRVVLLGMGIAAKDMVVVGGVEVDLDVVLVAVDQSCLECSWSCSACSNRWQRDRGRTRTKPVPPDQWVQ